MKDAQLLASDKESESQNHGPTMPSVPLFTSIPPVTKRVNSSGDDFGADYQETCLRSWIASGFDIYSINAVSEILPRNLGDRVHVQRVTRDAINETGRALPYLNDMFSVIRDIAKGGPFVLTNADIMFRNGSAFLDDVSKLKKGECIIERRWDVGDTEPSSAAQPYQPGFDLFAFHFSERHLLDCGDFVFGVPWWDHALPIRSMMAGFIRVTLNYPVAFHLKHTERWDDALWLKFGKKFVEQIVPDADRPKHTSYIYRYREEVENKRIYTGMNSISLRNIIEMFGFIDDAHKESAFFYRLSRLNVDVIDRWKRD